MGRIFTEFSSSSVTVAFFSAKKSAYCSWEAESHSEDATGRLRGVRVRRLQAKAGRKFLGALQGFLALFETGAMIPEIIVKGWIALDYLPTASTFVPLAYIATLFFFFGRTQGGFVGARARQNSGAYGLVEA